jgi:hypothetical protein
LLGFLRREVAKPVGMWAKIRKVVAGIDVFYMNFINKSPAFWRQEQGLFYRVLFKYNF